MIYLHRPESAQQQVSAVSSAVVLETFLESSNVQRKINRILGIVKNKKINQVRKKYSPTPFSPVELDRPDVKANLISKPDSGTSFPE